MNTTTEDAVEKKSKELVNRFKKVTIMYVLNGEANEADVLDEAKECAIICVDEIIEMLGELNYGENGGRSDVFGVTFWIEVKEKIKSL